jgi:rsbT antagonist protein RsbS
MIETHRIPLIRLFGNLIVPIQVSLSDSLVERLRDDVTLAIEQGRVSGLIVDLSGVDMMDSYITRCIRDLALSARLMGVDTVVCGIPRAVVITLVEMGLGIPGIASALNLDRALERLVAGDSGAPLLTAVRGDHERLA